MLSKYNLKAVVFDDVEEEAKPLIDALNDERIPNIFINFKDDRRDDRKLMNIRIVFSDLIIGEYQAGDDNATVEAIRTSILDNMDENNGPFILAIWSKHNNLAETLKNRLLEINSKLNFVIVKLDKNDYFEKDGDKWILQKDKNFSDIKADINSQLDTLDYIPIFLEWEKDARNSISKILNTFLENIADRDKVKDTISSTVKTTLSRHAAANTQDKIDAFYRTLNTVLADSIENNTEPAREHEEFLNALDFENIDDDMKAEINRKTLFENPSNNELKAGNIYSFDDFKDKFSDDVIQEVCGYDNSLIGRDFRRHTEEEKKDTDDNIVLRFCKTICCPDSLLSKNKLKKECKEFAEKNMFPILMEFTPSCDIAQKKYLKSRLIYGIMFHSDIKCIANNSESLYITRFHFKYKDASKNLDGNYRLAFFIRNIFAVNPEKIKELTPMIRARKEFATDLQHAIANHISRIGISSLDL